MGAVPFTAPETMCSPIRGDTVDDTVLFGTCCLLLATSVAEKEPKLWRASNSPGAGMPRGTFLFPRSPWGIACLRWSYPTPAPENAAEGCSHCVSSPFGLVRAAAENRLTRTKLTKLAKLPSGTLAPETKHISNEPMG